MVEPRLCDNCKREPEPFELAGSSDIGYWFRVQKDGDPTVLMSDLTYAFCAVMVQNPPDEPDHLFWCERCVSALIGNCKPETD